MTGDGERLAVMETKIRALEIRIDELEGDRKSFFKWGLMGLGSLVIATISVIWSHLIK